MNETFVNNKVTLPQKHFDTVKSFDKSLDLPNISSFDDYFVNNKSDSLKNKNLNILKPIKHNTQTKNEKPKYLEKQNDSSNDSINSNASETTETSGISQTKNTQENSEHDKTNNESEKDTLKTATEKEDDEAINNLILNLTDMLVPLPETDVTHQTDNALNFTGLDSVASTSQIELLQSQIQDNELNDLNDFDLTADSDLSEEEIELTDMLTTDMHGDENAKTLETLLANYTSDNKEQINNAESVTKQSDNITSFNNTTIQTQQQTTQHIHIQKASNIEIVTQIPLKNDMFVNITKDVDNPNKIGINLEPAGMGEVELVIENNRDNAVIAIIRSDKPEILEQLRKESASLERFLNEAGLNLGSSGLGFEHKSQQDNSQQQNSNNEIITASISEASVYNNNTPSMTPTERLYATLDKQSIETGLDIRL